jgi:Holliday junction resolvasome RuvABC endonuclease subunit
MLIVLGIDPGMHTGYGVVETRVGASALDCG